MRPRLLSLIFPSNYPNFEADSIYAFNRILTSSLLAIEADLDVAVAGPASLPPIDERIPIYAFDTGIDKFQVRFGCAWSQLASILADVRPTVILLNMPEQAGAVSVIAKDILGLDVKVVSYVHYVPGVAGEVIDHTTFEKSMDVHGHGWLLIARLLEGVAVSDLTLTCSSFGVRLVKALYHQLLGPNAPATVLESLAPPVDDAERLLSRSISPDHDPVFVYNHRLYDEYGTNIVFPLISRAFEQTSRPFRVIVTNPTEGSDPSRRVLNPGVEANLHEICKLPFVEHKHFSNRVDYMKALGRCWGGIAPYKTNALWSMSAVDVLSAGRPVVAFDVAAFREMGLDEQHVARTEDEFVACLTRLSEEPPDETDRLRRSEVVSGFRGEIVAHRFLKLAL